MKSQETLNATYFLGQMNHREVLEGAVKEGVGVVEEGALVGVEEGPEEGDKEVGEELVGEVWILCFLLELSKQNRRVN